MNKNKRFLIIASAVVLISAISYPALVFLREVAVKTTAELLNPKAEFDRDSPTVVELEVTDSVGRTQRVEGVLRNNSEKSICFVKLRCALKDRDTDRELDAALVYAVGEECLPPKEKRGFRVHLDSNMSGYGYLFLGAECSILSYRSN